MTRYTAKLPKGRERFTAEQRDLLSRRTQPFLAKRGTGYPLDHLMQEAYLQGIRDAIQATEGETP